MFSVKRNQHWLLVGNRNQKVDSCSHSLRPCQERKCLTFDEECRSVCQYMKCFDIICKTWCQLDNIFLSLIPLKCNRHKCGEVRHCGIVCQLWTITILFLSLSVSPHFNATVDWVRKLIIYYFSSVFSHLDNHHLWDPNEFAVSCFRITMYSIQVHYTHVTPELNRI